MSGEFIEDAVRKKDGLHLNNFADVPVHTCEISPQTLMEAQPCEPAETFNSV